MKHLAWVLVGSVLGCGPTFTEKKKGKTGAETVQVTALPLEGFAPTVPVSLDSCRFEAEFVSWYASRYLKAVELKPGACATAADGRLVLPGDTRDKLPCAEGLACEALDVAVEKDGTKLGGFHLIHKREAAGAWGLAYPYLDSDLRILMAEGGLPREYVQSSPDPNLPFVSVTFAEAVKSF